VVSPLAVRARLGLRGGGLLLVFGGRLNASFNCVDRHLPELGDRTAIIWVEDEPGVYKHISYRELKHHVARVANVLLSHGVRKGDRVCLYMTMIPELVYTMLACARIGAVHSVVFGGFSADALRDRIIDARCKVVVTANEGLRGGKKVPLKKTVDRAIEGMASIDAVLVARRTDTEADMRPGRDYWLDEECHRQRSTCTNAWMGAEDPLFILYTSGSTGKPKGLMHTTGGYMVYAAFTHRLIFDYTRATSTSARPTSLGHRPQLHRLRAARERRDDGDLRVDAGVSRSRPLLAHHRRPGRERALYRAHRAARAGAGRRQLVKKYRRSSLRSSGRSASRSTRKCGAGTTTCAATAAARSWTPGGKPKPAAC